MTLILFSQTMFGNLVAFRILRRFRERSLISTASLTKIGTAFACMSAGGAVLLFFRERAPLPFFIGSLAVLQLLLKLKERRRIEHLNAQFPGFLDRWLLNLRMGFAAASAREKALMNSDEDFRALLAPLFEGGRPGERHLFLSTQQVLELQTTLTEPHSTSSRLQNLRRCVERATLFRRKSVQALRQATIQSAVLLIMHTGLCLFVVARGGTADNMDFIAGSTLLTVSGVLILRLLARRIKWTI